MGFLSTPFKVSITLNPTDLGHLSSAQRTLLSPLDYASAVKWRVAIFDALAPLLGHDRAHGLLDAPGAALYVGQGIEESTLAAYADYYAERDPSATLSFGRRRGVFTTRMAWEDVGDEAMTAFLRGEVFHDYYSANGMVSSSALLSYDSEAPTFDGTPLAGTRAAFIVFHEAIPSEEEDRRQRALLRLLHPAFEAGVASIVRWGAHREALLQSLDALGRPSAIGDLSGRLIHLTPGLESLLARDPERESIHAAIDTAIRAIARAARGGGQPVPSFTREVRTSRATYRLYGCVYGEALSGADQLAVVGVDDGAPPLPDVNELRERWGLTRRQAEVARLLALRKTDSEIAVLLGVSRYTARHHTEAVLVKLGLHDRRDVTRVLGGSVPS